MQDWVFAVGMILGIVALLGVLYVWIKRQVFGTGGSILSIVGFLLVGLSLWSNVKVAGPGMSLEFNRLENRVADIEENTDVISEEVVKTAEKLETTSQQFISLTQQLETMPGIRGAAFEGVREPVVRATSPNVTRLKAISELQNRPARIPSAGGSD